jgi:drug/metabolite transporter (DMT)-like permease
MDSLKQPLLPKPSSPPKKILYDQALLAAFAWAFSNFFFGLLSSHDFATSCLQFSGYLLFGLLYRLYQIFYLNLSLCDAFFQTLLSARSQGKLSQFLLNLFIGSFIFYILSWLTIIAARYAIIAEVNFGVIASCISLSTPMNAALGYVFYKEKLTKRMMVGTTIVVIGVVWVAFAKGNRVEGGGS